MRSPGSAIAVSSRIGMRLSARRLAVRSSPVSPGIITSSTSRSKAMLGEPRARLGGIARGGDAEALIGEVAPQQLAQPRIVVDHQEMRLGAVHGRYYSTRALSASADRARSGGGRPRCR